VRYADGNGRIRREKVANRGAAIQLYQKRKTQVLQGEKLPENFRARAVTFTELAQDALDYSQTHKRSYKQDNYRMAKLIDEFGLRPADTITSQDLERWLAEQAHEIKWKPATINRFKALLSLVFRLGIENGRIKNNPAKLVRHRRENNARIRFLSDAEEMRLRKIIQENYTSHMPEFEIALHTGLRCGEQYGVQWEDVDLERRLVTIILSKHGETRHIRLNTVAVSAFQQLFKQSSGHGFVFVNSRFERLLKPRHWFEPAVKAAELQDFTWHCLRHTFASRLVMKGVDLRSVQMAMGHKSIQMTCRYAHLAPNHELASVEKLCETVIAPEAALENPSDTRSGTSTLVANLNGTTRTQ
jgi:site-specific recombinase XerD